MSIETVKNIKGTAEAAPVGYSYWKAFWEAKTGKTASSCHKIGCTNWSDRIVGAHVQIEGYGNYWYIVPLCHPDNMSNGSFRAMGPFVPVNPDRSIIW